MHNILWEGLNKHLYPNTVFSCLENDKISCKFVYEGGGGSSNPLLGINVSSNYFHILESEYLPELFVLQQQ